MSKDDNDDIVMFYGANKKIFERAKELRKSMTNAEKVFWMYSKKHKLFGLKFRRQHPIYFFIADFYCHEKKLVVEIDGGIHDEEYNKERDIGRNYMMNELGIKVIRIKNEEIEENIDKVFLRIKNEIM